jgi:hypothetical protein
MMFPLRILSRNSPVREHEKSERARLSVTGKFAGFIGKTSPAPQSPSPAADSAAKAAIASLKPTEGDNAPDDAAPPETQPIERSNLGMLITPVLAAPAYQPPPPPAEEPDPENDAAGQALKPAITALLNDAPTTTPTETRAAGEESPVAQSEVVEQLAAQSGEAVMQKPATAASKQTSSNGAQARRPSPPLPPPSAKPEEERFEGSNKVSETAGEKISPASPGEPPATPPPGGSHISSPVIKGLVKDAPGSGEPENARGMSAALQESTMQPPHEVDETSGAARQNLPSFGDAGESAHSQEPPAEKAGRAKRAPVASDEAIPPVPPASPDRAADFSAAAPEKGASPTSRAVAQTADRLAEDLRRGNAVSMVLTLKPDAGTHISLHVKQHAGHLEAIAVLERGDFKTLNSEWNQLQTRLAKRGIRLAPLVGNGTRADSGGNAPSSRRQSPNPSACDLPGPAETTRAAGRSATQNATPPVATEWWA